MLSLQNVLIKVYNISQDSSSGPNCVNHPFLKFAVLSSLNDCPTLAFESSVLLRRFPNCLYPVESVVRVVNDALLFRESARPSFFGLVTINNIEHIRLKI